MTIDVQYDSEFFEAKRGIEIIEALPDEINTVVAELSPSDQFDYLVSLTYALLLHNYWAEEISTKIDKDRVSLALKILEQAWKHLLTNRDSICLGIDPQDRYTMPGTIALLHKFQNVCEKAGFAFNCN